MGERGNPGDNHGDNGAPVAGRPSTDAARREAGDLGLSAHSAQTRPTAPPSLSSPGQQTQHCRLLRGCNRVPGSQAPGNSCFRGRGSAGAGHPPVPREPWEMELGSAAGGLASRTRGGRRWCLLAGGGFSAEVGWPQTPRAAPDP